jgi:hypothetical protein
MMQTLFAEVFVRQDWLRLWDHFVTNPPAFMYYFIAAYIRHYRVALLDIKRIEDFKV